MEILLVHLCIRTSVFYLHFTSRHRQKKKKKTGKKFGSI